ncbi:MAG: hypothetical protein KAQ69_00535 [Spirochaetales bacterium]|nr:hypothetical protein [Spirochaetales bacterium]
MPINKKVDTNSDDYPLRYLDCAVIQMIHQRNEWGKKTPYDSVRGVFWEGNAPYNTSGFREKNHIQINVRNPNCIKGYFIPRKKHKEWCIP